MGGEKMPAAPIPIILTGSAVPGDAPTADAAAKLAGDVNAAAKALENLKRLLHRQSVDPVRARPQRSPNREVHPRLAALPLPPSPTNLVSAVPQSGSAPPLFGRSVRRLDIRSFLAGFVLSAAVGAALYFCLATG